MTHTVTVAYKYYEIDDEGWVDSQTGIAKKRFNGSCDENEVLTVNSSKVTETV